MWGEGAGLHASGPSRTGLRLPTVEMGSSGLVWVLLLSQEGLSDACLRESATEEGPALRVAILSSFTLGWHILGVP